MSKTGARCTWPSLWANVLLTSCRLPSRMSWSLIADVPIFGLGHNVMFPCASDCQASCQQVIWTRKWYITIFSILFSILYSPLYSVFPIIYYRFSFLFLSISYSLIYYLLYYLLFYFPFFYSLFLLQWCVTGSMGPRGHCDMYPQLGSMCVRRLMACLPLCSTFYFCFIYKVCTIIQNSYR